MGYTIGHTSASISARCSGRKPSLSLALHALVLAASMAITAERMKAGENGPDDESTWWRWWWVGT